MSLNPGRAVLALATALALVAAGGFGVAVFGQRPLEVGGVGEQTCAPSSMYSDVAFGIYITNTSTSALTLKSIDFATLEGLDVAEVSVAIPDPQSDGSVLGYGLENYPPTENHPGWAERVPLAGAEIQPGELASIVLRVKATGEDGGLLEGATVHYVAPGAALGAAASSDVAFEISKVGC